ncbi:hypothetical protein MBLNU13_g06440t1 [Cladosporium sp. NU13]
MDGHFPPAMTPYGAYNPYGQPQMISPESMQPRLHHLQTMSSESLGGYHSEYDDINNAMLPPHAPAQQPSSRSRRRQTHGADHIKHRRTRSGCFTCRQRRVKCDETRPMCERCRKGKRECEYPDHPSSSKSDRGTRSKRAHGDSHSDHSGDDSEHLPTITDEEETDAHDETELRSAVSESGVRFPTSRSGKSTPTTEYPPQLVRTHRPQASRSNSKQLIRDDITQNPRWATLPQNVKFYLKYHRNNLSHHHYSWKYDAGDFLKKTFLEIALNFEPLMYAVVAFAAYHNALSREDGKVKDFLDAYNKSVSLLRQSLARTDRHSLSTLLTILQLATIEEFLGDWVNLLSHQRAAHQIITDLFTPQTIMQSETHRKIISWYIRFDLFAGMMSGGTPILGREWFDACAEFYKRQARDRPNDSGARFEDMFATSRLIATDIALLLASKVTGEKSDEQFASEVQKLMTQMDEYGERLDNTFTDPSCFVKTFPKAPPPSDDEITEFRDPNFCLAGDLFSMNYILIDFWAMQLMFKLQLATTQSSQSELEAIALKKCKMFEAVDFSDQGPPGAVLGFQASLGIACLLLPKEQKYTDWARRKFALMEKHGYIYPASLRKRMSDLWGVDVTGWWLPNDEGYPPVLRALRDFIDFRAMSAAKEPDAKDVDVRDMAGIFRTMNIERDMPDHVTELMQGDGGWFEGDMYESSPDQAAQPFSYD